MNKFIDNTYIHDIYSCLNRKAYNIKQFKTFLRFIGEIIATDELFYTVDKNGPVFPTTKKTVDIINGITGNSYIKYLGLHKQGFEEICNSVIFIFKKEFKFISYELYEDTFSIINPIFEVKNPHEEVKKLLMSGRKNLYMKHSEPLSSNFVPFILLQDSIREEIMPYIQNKRGDMQFIQFISIFIRMLAYGRMAELHNLYYMPATSRLDNELFNFTVNEYNILRLKDNINKDDIRPHVFNGISDIVDALIVYCNGEPLEIIKEAFVLRKKTETLRKKFLNETHDALLIKNNKINEIQEQLNVIFRKEGNNSTGMVIQSNKAIIGFPKKTIKSNLKKNWLKYKNDNNSIKYFANMFLYADERRKFNIYKRLLINCLMQNSFDGILSYQNKENSRNNNTVVINGDLNINKNKQIGVQIIGNNNTTSNIENVRVSSCDIIHNDPNAIVSNINTLINKLKQFDHRYIKEIRILSDAKNEIEKQDKKTAFRHLKKIGAETWSIAKEIGVSVLTDFILKGMSK
jgi:hypothetical protein